ncbi:hypothetical protein LCGC14_3003360 [marine sediment metagenome]|uniref:Uncharacterized protein n=1 Tax=marine sediment metagenome TaxID=412755 RepID=A0A0F8ZRF8_9ZZZZ
MRCPCDLPDGVENAYQCALITEISGVPTRMTPDWCRLYLTRHNYHKAWDEGRGPGQPVESNESSKSPTPRPPQEGPGTELLKLLGAPVKVLRWVRWLRPVKEWYRRRKKTKKGCAGSCLAYARLMNAWGVDGCRARMDEIVDHLESQTAEEGIVFERRAARLMVRLAIRRAANTASKLEASKTDPAATSTRPGP